MKRIRSIILLLVFVVAGILTGCSARKNFAAMKYTADSAPMRSGGVYAAEEKSAGTLSDAALPLPENRKLIRTGNIRFEVSSLAETKAATEAWGETLRRLCFGFFGRRPLARHDGAHPVFRF